MTRLHDQIPQTLLPGMFIPGPLELLFEWIEAKRFYVDTEPGTRIGSLYLGQLGEDTTDTERHGGTFIEFLAEGNVNMKYWFWLRIYAHLRTGRRGHRFSTAPRYRIR
jgi:hypothetical protein